ncbi:hypothetical protein D3C81_1641520 [compost metagenome]
MEAPHRLQHVVGQLSAGAVRPTVQQGARHVGRADAAAVLGIAREQRDLGPGFLADPTEFDRAAEGIRIRYKQRAFGSMNFDRGQRAATKNIEAGG